ncbi:hypothetical protein ACG94_27265 (plasmid) [Klebsiella pneumoniae]|nr:hypothetical protein ACG94_27265 [Klebsiella pneumoniae]
MHSINKANFAILHWFGLCFEPHFTDLNRQLQVLYCTREPRCLIQPVGQIDLDLITRGKKQSRAYCRHARTEGNDAGNAVLQTVYSHNN